MVIPGYILAGGASVRMGEDKALLKLNGIPLATKIANTLLRGGCSSITLVGRQPALQTLGFRTISESEQNFHPLYGVAKALQDTQSTTVLIAPCDLISLPSEAIQRLIHHGRPCVAFDGQRRHPLLAILPVVRFRQAYDLALSNSSASSLVNDLPTIQMPSEWLHNANSMQDLHPESGPAIELPVYRRS